MELEDLAGLSKPLTRLVEVVSQGVGAIAKPSLIRRTADAKAYELKVLSAAMKEAGTLPNQTDYSSGDIMVSGTSVPFFGIDERASIRNQFQELKAQQNIEDVVANAAEDLVADETISDALPDQDWISRFFDSAKYINSDQLQYLWGKILAGEIREPGTFSLRTMDLDRNISKHEAELFGRLANFIVESNGNFVIPNPDNLLESICDGLKFDDFLLLREAGILQPGELLRFWFPANTAGSSSHLTCGNIIIIFDRTADTPDFGLDALVMTRTGKELMRLVRPIPNMKYIHKFVQKMYPMTVAVSWANILSASNGVISYGPKFQIPRS